MKKEKYVLGLDIGISSVGWAAVRLDENDNPIRIIDANSKIFSPGEVPKTGASKNLIRRTKRDTGRVIRRRSFRIDRVRHLLNLNGYLGDDIIEGLVSDVNDKLTLIYSNMLNKYYKNKNTNPYELKVAALDRKLTPDELSIILVHYAKHRGYRSNREDNTDDKETGKVKKSITDNEELMQNKNYRIISEMFLKDEKFKDRIRNSTDDYKMCVSREMYQKEIEIVLDSQIKYGLITEEFKNDYIKIWSSQRHYAKGPGKPSKYGGDLIVRMTGKCKFDNNLRAPKYAPSSEIFVALTNLVNLRYHKFGNINYIGLTKEEIEKVIALAKSKDNVTYASLFKELGYTNVTIKGLSLSKKEYNKALTKFKSKYKIDEKSTIDFTTLSEEKKIEFNELKTKEVLSRNFISLKAYSDMRKAFSTKLNTEEWYKISDNYELLDTIATILTNYKLNEDVEKAIKENNIDERYKDIIKSLPNYKEHMMLSLDLIRKLNKIMITGKTYDTAMEELGYNHSLVNENSVKEDLLIPINQDNELTNQRVIRSLSQARSIINSVIKKYGMPERINIETARELAKSMEERREIENKQKENHENNEKTREEIFNLGIFKSKDDIKSFDLLKYKLWKEQLEHCTYSGEPITIEDLFDNNIVQVDHILPYSRTFDDTYFNKTLVLSKYNQDKKNNTPYEWFGKDKEKWNNFVGYISSLNIPTKKKDNYLLTNLTPEMEAEYRNQNLNDTKYIARYLVSYIKANLNVKKVGCPSGSITGKLRNYWQLNGLTHSLESETYYVKNRDENTKKNRENHLHHAMDAILIAITNEKIIKRVSDYERYKRYLDNKPISYIINYAKSMDDSFEINNFTDEETGELYENSLKKYIADLRTNEFFQTNKKNNTIKTYLPTPYADFREEAIVRVYEQNKEILRNKLRAFHYNEEDLENAVPLIPKFAKNKVGGPLHGETYYGLKTYKDGNETKYYKTSRISLNSDKFTKDKLDNIIDKDSGSRIVYDTISAWLENDNGKEAFAKHNGYPINPTTNAPIKKIKIKSDYDGKGHIIGNKIVEKEDIYQIDIYKKKDEDRLYFVAYDAMELYQIKERKDKNGNIIKPLYNIPVDLWWGQGKNHKKMKYLDLQENYEFYVSLQKNEFIEIILNNGNKGYAYVKGFSSGQFEVGSALGDSLDIIGEKNLFQGARERYQLTISTIKSIKKVKLNNLGKIE